MDIKKMFKFLFPEYQIIESIREYGFIAKKENKAKSSTSYQANSYSTNKETSYGMDTHQVKQMEKNKFGKHTEINSDTIIHNEKKLVKVSNDGISESFESIRNKLSTALVGQQNFLDNLIVAFKRPFITGYDNVKPKNTIFIIGEESTGRHTCIEETVKLLKQKELLSYDNVSKIDLSIYPTVSEQSLFLSDLYKELYTNSDVIIFDCFEKCHSSVIDIISKLVIDGKYKLNARYAFQNNNLVEATGVLMQNSVSELSSNGKYFIFVTEQRESKIMDIFGSKFMAAVSDLLKMNSYTEKELAVISEKLLSELNLRCKSNLSIILKYDDSLAAYCAGKYSFAYGIAGIQNYINENIYKALSEYKLRNTIESHAMIELFIENEKIMAKIMNKQGDATVDLMELLPQSNINNIDEVKKELDSVIGLTKVKEYVLDIENNFKVQKMRENAGLKAASISMHMIFTGNPGTGKTTIARIVAKYLKAIGVLSTGQLREVTRMDLVGQYVGQTAKLTNEVIQSALGGVLFIDEAYSLCRDKHDTFGLEAIDALVKGIEDNRDNLVVILAGYKDEMAEFLKSNSGLKSRFPNIVDFEDYTADEMYEISIVTAKSKGYAIAENCKEELIRLFERSQIKGRNDSGNGRLVRNIVESAILEQSKRLVKDQSSPMDLLSFEDFKFESFEKFDLDKALSDIIGLENVKEFVRSQYKLLIANEKRRKAGINVDTTQSLNMIFTGNPGTGKTTIARVVATMFKDMGLLKKGHLVETDRGGLVAEYAGQTAKKTEEIFKNALGGVLFIDEAYALSSDGSSFGKEAIDTLVKLIEDYRGEIIVILAGYKKEMADFMKSNSGLESRFPLIINFPDYSSEELYEIALKIMDSKGFQITEEGKSVLGGQIEILHKTSTAHSGNGRMVRNLIEKIMRNQSARIASDEVTVDDLTKILPCDIETTDNKTQSYDIDKALEKIIGLSEVKSYIRSLYARLKMQNERKKLGLPSDSSATIHMIFKGNPGTGKTMVARTVADILYNIGVIKTNKLIETDRAGLVAGYVGQTAMKTTEKVMEAMDGILFIDEAYSLSQGGANDFGRESIDTLVKLMDDYRERIVVILAGYSKDMDDFLKTNPGLKSRFPNIIEFADYNLDELMQIANEFYQNKGYVLTENAKNKLSVILNEVLKEEAFGNGRYVRNVFEKSVNNQALRLSTDTDLTREELTVIEEEDMERV